MPNVSKFGAQTDNAVVQGTVTDRAMIVPDVPPQGLMSVGPRVTPHFVKPSLWSALTTYHFFDAVHDVAGASYVAIKPEVPAGTELTDEDYWFLWADPNSQFADLSELVKTYDARITENTEDIKTNTSEIAKSNTSIATLNTKLDTSIAAIKKKLKAQLGDYAVVIGNSYTRGANVPTGGMFAKISKYFSESKMFVSEGAGFMPYTTGSISITTSFKDLILQAQAEMDASSRANVTDVFFVMAMGDSRYASYNNVMLSTSTYVQQVLATMNKTREVFPNAIIHVMNAELKALDKNIGHTTAKDVWSINRSFDRWFKTYNVHWMGMLAYAVWGDPAMVQADGYHPTQNGYIRLDAGFVNAMYGFTEDGRGLYVPNGHHIAIYNSDATSLEDTSTEHCAITAISVDFAQNAFTSVPIFNINTFTSRNVSKIRIYDDMGTIGAFAQCVVTIIDNQNTVYTGMLPRSTKENASELLVEFTTPITITTERVKIILSTCIK